MHGSGAEGGEQWHCTGAVGPQYLTPWLCQDLTPQLVLRAAGPEPVAAKGGGTRATPHSPRALAARYIHRSL